MHRCLLCLQFAEMLREETEFGVSGKCHSDTTIQFRRDLLLDISTVSRLRSLADL